MTTCPQCQQLINSQAIDCPYCQTTLKAFGHPGMPLSQATQTEFLCDRCLYHEDDSCTYDKRPFAKTCMLYQDKTQPILNEDIIKLTPTNPLTNLKRWSYRHRRLLLIVGLIGISLAIAVAN